jgi:hypothetical protein
MTGVLIQAAYRYRQLLIKLDKATQEFTRLSVPYRLVEAQVAAFELEFEDDLSLIVDWSDTNLK